jgi:twitching motility protein PilT
VATKPIEEMLRHLNREDVAEFGLVSGRLPCVKVGEVFQPVDEEAPSLDGAMQMLIQLGGSRYVDSLGARPTSWTARVDGVGAVSVTAVLRDGTVQVRIKVTRRDPNAKAPAAAAPPRARASKSPPARRAAEDEDGPTLETTAAVPARARPTDAQESTLPEGPAPGPKRGDEPTLEAKRRARAEESEAKKEDKTLGERTLESRKDERAKDRRPSVEVEIGPISRGAPPAAVRESRPPPRPHVDVEVSSEPSVVPPFPAPPAAEVRRHSRAFHGSRPPPRMTEADSERARIIAAPGKVRDSGLEALLALAREVDASDLHVVAGRPPLLRLLGELEPRGEPVPPAAVEAMVAAAVPAAQADALRVAGSCDFALEHPEHGRFRVNASQQRTGLKLSMRLIPREVPTLQDLGLPPSLGEATHAHQGLIVVTGPTGHGKTTTLAALVDLINRETTHHVVTVEDPIEHIHGRKKALMSQREVHSHTKSFARALKAALREDPDVIVVGELRDVETVRMAVAASETGHLVLGTMNTPSAAKTIDRLIDLFPPGDQAQVRITLAGGLRLIVSQRLVPAADRSGRVAAVEVLPGSVPLWSLIRDNKTFQISSLQQRGKALGIVRLDDALNELVRAGEVTVDAARAVAEAPAEIGRRP